MPILNRSQWYNLTPDLIKGAAEIHPDKMGRYMVGSQIPIVHEDEARKDADYFIMAAAVADYQPRNPSNEKLKRNIKDQKIVILGQPYQ